MTEKNLNDNKMVTHIFTNHPSKYNIINNMFSIQQARKSNPNLMNNMLNDVQNPPIKGVYP